MVSALSRLVFEATSQHHASADEARLAAMNVASRSEYRALLLRIYGLESSIEHALLQVRDMDPVFLEPRLRSMLLRQDLRALGLLEVDIGSVAYTANLSIESGAHALGWMFVLERQMLVSGLIKRELDRALGDELDGATSYFSAYGDRPGAKYRAFTEDLSRQASRHLPRAITAGVVDAYRAHRQWYGIRAAPPASSTTHRQDTVDIAAAS
jgi:heme oxygenase